MNAYELADKMEKLAGHFHNEAINMLRQQADRIAELENQLDKYSHYEAMTHQEYMQQIKELELKLFKATNRAIATRKKLSKVKKEKIRAYDNGYEDGWKSLQHQSEQIETLLSFLRYKGLAGQWIIYNANEMVRKANTQLHPESTK